METEYNGVIEQTEEQKEKNYPFTEIVAAAEQVLWLTKQKPTGLNFIMGTKFWRKFPTRNQDGSLSCVAQTLAKLMGILAWLRWKIFIVFSGGHIYIRRSNTDTGGMIGTNAFEIAGKGVTLEEFMPSQDMGESEINALKENELHKAVKLSISDNYIVLPIKDLEVVASVIQRTLKGVMTWFRFSHSEWTAVPVILTNNPTSHHSVASVDLTLYDNEKSLVIDESWGNTYGFDGQRVIKENFYKVRNTFAAYPMDFKFDSGNIPTPTPQTFTKPLVFIPVDTATQQVKPEFEAIHQAQKTDVIRLQDILKKEGLFPTNVASTGLYQNLTRKSVKAFQLKHKVAPIDEINSIDGKRVGSKTLAKLNELYS